MKKLCLLGLILVACSAPEEEIQIDIQGHRGARGLAPENSLEAFVLATNMGVNTLELDLIVSKDSQLVVSHEPFFSPDFCLDPDGSELNPDSLINMFQLDYDDIAAYDCGSKGNPKYPEQDRFAVQRPLLSDVLDSIEALVTTSGREPVYYNIELKTKAYTDSIYHPRPEVFSDLVYKMITQKNLWDRVNIQSFDFRTLKYFNQTYPDVKLALLIENTLAWEKNIDSLGFTPEIYSCYFKLLSPGVVDEMQEKGMKVIPWTVNEVADLNEMLALEVDGIITDYPDRALTLIKK